MRIKLLCDLPVEPEHGMVGGRVVEIAGQGPGGIFLPSWWVWSDANAELGVWQHEAEVVQEEE